MQRTFKFRVRELLSNTNYDHFRAWTCRFSSISWTVEKGWMRALTSTEGLYSIFNDNRSDSISDHHTFHIIISFTYISLLLSDSEISWSHRMKDTLSFFHFSKIESERSHCSVSHSTSFFICLWCWRYSSEDIQHKISVYFNAKINESKLLTFASVTHS